MLPMPEVHVTGNYGGLGKVKRGVCYWGPGDLTHPSIPDEGRSEYHLLIDGEPRKITPHIAPIRKPLVSVSDMNDKGHDVFFPHNGQAMAIHSSTGTITKFHRVGGRFEIEAEVVPAPNCPPGRRGESL